MSLVDANLARRRHGPGWASHDSRQSPAGPFEGASRCEGMGWGSCSSAAYHHCCCSAAPLPSCETRLLSSPTLKQPNSTKNRSLVGLLQETSTPATRMTWCGEVARNSSAGSRRILSWAAMAVLYKPGHAPSRPAALEVEATAAAVPLAGYALGSAASDEGFDLTKVS